MSNTEKICIACDSKISGKAKRCPHCQSWQTKLTLLHSNPMVLVIIGIVVISMFGGMIYDIYDSISDKNISFSNFTESIQIQDSKIDFTESDNCNSIICVGHLRNNSYFAWEYLSIEVQYFDSEGNMIDTTVDKNYDIVIPPRGNVAFKVRGIADKPKETYSNHTVYIRWAKKVGK